MENNTPPWVIKAFTAKKFAEKDFPNDKLGVGDKLILTKMVREENDGFLNTKLIVSVLDRMRDYGFNPNLQLERLKKYF